MDVLNQLEDKSKNKFAKRPLKKNAPQAFSFLGRTTMGMDFLKSAEKKQL